MRLYHAARTRLRLLLARRAAEMRMHEEFVFHLDMEAERLVREVGLAPEAARREARLAFGYVERLEPWSHASQHVYLRGLAEPLTMSRRFGARLRDRFG